MVVGLRGLEPLTSSLSGKRSNRLSYRPFRHLQRVKPPESGATGARRMTLPHPVSSLQNGPGGTLAACDGEGLSVVRQGELKSAH